MSATIEEHLEVVAGPLRGGGDRGSPREAADGDRGHGEPRAWWGAALRAQSLRTALPLSLAMPGRHDAAGLRRTSHDRDEIGL